METAFKPNDDEIAALQEFVDRLLGRRGRWPVSFYVAGSASAELVGEWDRESEPPRDWDGGTHHEVTWRDPEKEIECRVDADVYTEFPAVEWVLHVHNDGSEDTPTIGDIQPLDAVFSLREGDTCTIHYSLGSLCSAQDFAPVEHELLPNARLRLNPGGGRSSSEVLPFFNVDFGGRGVILGIGWTGEWAAEFTRADEGDLQVRAGMDYSSLKLHPDEAIRTPLVLMIFWSGERIRGHNLLRRLIMQHHRPHVDGEPVVAPLCNGNWGGTPAEVHLENVGTIIEHDLPFEYYWIDAEWFGGEGHWKEHAGHWEPREDLYPNGFEPISDLLHEHGRKLLLWFEPERVAPGTPWASEYDAWLLEVPAEEAVTWDDYGPHTPPEEWVKMESARNQLNPGDKLFNLADTDARRFLTDFLSEKIEEYGIDCLRWDSNIAQLAYWRNADAPDREGITEIRYVEGQYALWDELLQRHPGLLIDNCSSGGRRIDLESLRRSVPLWRTDYTVGHQDLTAIQCHTYGILHWVALNGTGGAYLSDAERYTVRSIMSSAVVMGLWGHGDARQEHIPDDYPFEKAKQLLEEYLEIREYYYGDYYPLTEYTRADDAWMAYQLDRPEAGDGLVVALKRPESPYNRAVFALHGLDAEEQYEIENLDTGEARMVAGAELVEEGLEIALLSAPDSALVRYRVLASEH